MSIQSDTQTLHGRSNFVDSAVLIEPTGVLLGLIDALAVTSRWNDLTHIAGTADMVGSRHRWLTLLGSD